MSSKNAKPVKSKNDNELPASLKYPASDDIYNKGKREEDIDPNDGTIIDATDSVKQKGSNEKYHKKDKSGDDLDIPGAELDDADEIIGEEDEENNYYSIGGDNHDDLEEERE